MCVGFCGCALLQANVINIKLELIIQWPVHSQNPAHSSQMKRMGQSDAMWWDRNIEIYTLKYIDIHWHTLKYCIARGLVRTCRRQGSVNPTTEAPKEWSRKILHHANLCRSAGEAGENGSPTGVRMGFVWFLAELQQLCQGSGRCSVECLLGFRSAQVLGSCAGPGGIEKNKRKEVWRVPIQGEIAHASLGWS